jgi:hypothetical protein
MNFKELPDSVWKPDKLRHKQKRKPNINMKTSTTQIVPLDWNEAKQLEKLLNSAADGRQALVVDPTKGVSETMPTGLISPNENVNGSVRFGTHYGV